MCVLKYLMKHLPDGPVGGADSDIPYDLFDEYLNEAAKGPFALAQEMKTPERKISDRYWIMWSDYILYYTVFSSDIMQALMTVSVVIRPHTNSLFQTRCRSR